MFVSCRYQTSTNASTYQESLSRVLTLTYDEIVSHWMKDHKDSLKNEKSFLRLYVLAMKSKGDVDWFKPHTDASKLLAQPQ